MTRQAPWVVIVGISILLHACRPTLLEQEEDGPPPAAEPGTPEGVLAARGITESFLKSALRQPFAILIARVERVHASSTWFGRDEDWNELILVT